MIIVLICHFTNKEIQSILKSIKEVGEVAPWIPPLIRLFENDKKTEVHIFSPHEYIFGYKKFVLRNIHYHFINVHIPFWGRHWPGMIKIDYLTDFLLTKLKYRLLINKINPDIIHLIGVENSYYSSTVLQFYNKIPVVITIQGFINKTLSRNYQIDKRIKVERQILNKFQYYITNTKTVGKDILTINPHAKIYQVNFPLKDIKPFAVKKKYDIVFFARITRDKGIEDLLKAVSIIKKEKSNISLCVIGSGKIDPFKKLAEELGIQNNIYWAGFLPTQDDVHRLASSARISVLPTYHDIISGTIIESLFLKIPVVAYNVGSIHEVNNQYEIISLVKKGDVPNLADKIGFLLKNENLKEKIALKGRERALEMFNKSDEKIKRDILNVYNKVILDFTKAK